MHCGGILRWYGTGCRGDTGGILRRRDLCTCALHDAVCHGIFIGQWVVSACFVCCAADQCNGYERRARSGGDAIFGRAG